MEQAIGLILLCLSSFLAGYLWSKWEEAINNDNK